MRERISSEGHTEEGRKDRMELLVPHRGQVEASRHQQSCEAGHSLY